MSKKIDLSWEEDALPVQSTDELIKAVKRHAMNNYNKGGWDFVVECWSDDDIADAIVGCANAKAAIRKVARSARALHDRRTDICNA